MFFKKNTPPTQSFKKEMLSPLALDHFVETYPSRDGDIPYVLQSGKTVMFNTAKVLRTNGGKEHFLYLLGQTAPYHISSTPRDFILSELAYILDENNNKIPWTTNSKVLSQFVSIGHLMGYVQFQKHNDNMYFLRQSNVPAIKHRERTHTDD